jgi:hypothetical protein
VAFAWSIWLVNKPKDRVEAYSLVFAEAKSCAENYLTKATTEFSKKHYGIEYEFIKLHESPMLPNPSNISHILKISRYNYPATSRLLIRKKWVQLEFGVQSNGGTS